MAVLHRHVSNATGPSRTFDDEFNQHKIERGALAMANAGPNTNGSQFFIVTTDAAPWLDGKHTVFGEVTAGMEAVDAIEGLPTGPGDQPEEPAVIERVELPDAAWSQSLPGRAAVVGGLSVDRAGAASCCRGAREEGLGPRGRRDARGPVPTTEAERERFVGSPTIRIDGVEVAPEPGEPAGLTCRVYRLRDGRSRRCPTLRTSATRSGGRHE